MKRRHLLLIVAAVAAFAVAGCETEQETVQTSHSCGARPIETDPDEPCLIPDDDSSGSLFDAPAEGQPEPEYVRQPMPRDGIVTVLLDPGLDPDQAEDASDVTSSDKRSCSKCGGSGRTDCTRCNGAGNESCGFCWGSGSMDVTCRTCNGSGRSGDDVCGTCNGTRTVTEQCDNCGGRGVIPCGRCSGQATEQCSMCGGSGTTGLE